MSNFITSRLAAVQDRLSQTNNLLFLLKVFTAFVLLGRAWQHLRWDIPIRALLWEQELMEPLVNLLGYNWRTYAESLTVDRYISGFVFFLGLLYLVCAGAALLARRDRPWTLACLRAGSLLLLSLGLLTFMEKFQRFPELMEFASQIGAPLFLLWMCTEKFSQARLLLFMKAAVALTFVGHGFYALGIFPTPAGFPTMIMNIFPVTEDTASSLLLTAGLADILVAVLIFVPQLGRYALLYCVAWGFATAMARVTAYFNLAAPLPALEQWLHETVFRLIHGALPLIAYFIEYKIEKKEEERNVREVRNNDSFTKKTVKSMS